MSEYEDYLIREATEGPTWNEVHGDYCDETLGAVERDVTNEIGDQQGDLKGVKVDHPFFDEIYLEKDKMCCEALRQQPIAKTVTILYDDYEGLKNICRFYREKVQELTKELDKAKIDASHLNSQQSTTAQH